MTSTENSESRAPDDPEPATESSGPHAAEKPRGDVREPGGDVAGYGDHDLAAVVGRGRDIAGAVAAGGGGTR